MLKALSRHGARISVSRQEHPRQTMQTTPAPRARGPVPARRRRRSPMSSSPDFLRGARTSRRRAARCWPRAWPPRVAPGVRAAPARTLTVAAYPAGRPDRQGRDAAMGAAPSRRRHQRGHAPVRRPPHGDDDRAVDGGLPARRDGARGVVRRQVLQRRRPVRPAAAALRHRPLPLALRRLRLRPGDQPQGPGRGRAHRHRPGHACSIARTCSSAPASSAADLQPSWDAYVDGGIRSRRPPAPT